MHRYRRHQLLELDLAELAAHDKVDQPQEETGRPFDRWKVRCHRFSLLFELFGTRLSTGPYSIDTWQREDVTEARARPTQRLPSAGPSLSACAHGCRVRGHEGGEAPTE